MRFNNMKYKTISRLIPCFFQSHSTSESRFENLQVTSNKRGKKGSRHVRNLWTVWFFLVGMVCLLLSSVVAMAQMVSTPIQMNDIYSLIFGGTTMYSSSLNFPPADSVPHQSLTNLVQDSNFERFGQFGGPWGKGQYGEKGIWWNSYYARSTARTIVLRTTDTLYTSYGIRTALYITNHSPVAPHVYGTTVQQIFARPGKYTISIWAAAKNLSNGAIYIVVDRPWRVRPINLPGGSYGWRKFTGSFITNTGEIQLRIISANTGEACLTGISVTPSLY
jgi:hypothetical protein